MKQKELYAKLVAAGYENLLPIIPRSAELTKYSTLNPSDLGKIPGKQVGTNLWSGFSGWTKYRSTESDYEFWSTWDNHPVCVQADKFPGFDIDIDEPELAEQVYKIIEEELPASAVRVREGSSRRLYSFRLDDNCFIPGVQRVCFSDGAGEKEKSLGMVEILGPKHQYLLEGEHKSGAWQELKGRPALITKEDIDRVIGRLQKIESYSETKKTKTKGIDSFNQRPVRVRSETGKRSYSTMCSIIRAWRGNSGRHDALRDVIRIKMKIGEDVAKLDAVMLMEQVSECDRDQTWLDYLRDIQRMADEWLIKDGYATIPDLILPNTLPDFPKLVLPEALQMMHEAWMGNIFNPEEILLVPFEEAFAGFLLGGKVLTPHMGRVPTLHPLCLAPSTKGKDQHSSDLLNDLFDCDWSSKEIQSFIETACDTPGIITADTSLLQQLHNPNRAHGMFWLVTEAADNIERLANNKNPSMSAINKMLRLNFDGKRLTGVTKVENEGGGKQSVGGIAYPNMFVPWYLQPYKFFQHLSPGILADGFLGRNDYYVCEGDDEITSMFDNDSQRTRINNGYPKEFVSFVEYVYMQCRHPLSGVLKRVRTSMKACPKLAEFERSLLRDDPDLQLFLRRIGMSLEKRATIYAAYERLWQTYNQTLFGELKTVSPWDKPIVIGDHIIDMLLPMGEYQVKVREGYVYGKIGNSLGRKQEEAIIGIMKDILEKPEAGYDDHQKKLARDGKVALSYIKKRIKMVKAVSLDQDGLIMQRLKDMCNARTIEKGDGDYYMFVM